MESNQYQSQHTVRNRLRGDDGIGKQRLLKGACRDRVRLVRSNRTLPHMNYKKYEYIAGGHFREVGIPKKEIAHTLHGNEIIKYYEKIIKELQERLDKQNVQN